MYSVIDTSGVQQKVTLGETLKVPKLTTEKGADFVYSKVLLHSQDGDPVVGTPHVPDASVTVEILSHGRGSKLEVFKRNRRKRYRKTQGHRQDYTEVIVKEISGGGKSEKADKVLLSRARARIVALENNLLSKPAEEKEAEKKPVENKMTETKAAETKAAEEKAVKKNGEK